MLPPIKGFLPSSLIEWRGKIVAALFLPGCNLRCRYCHSAELVLHPDNLPDIPWEEVKESTLRREGWLDGVEVTGGEPTLHKGLPELLEGIKHLQLAVKLDTNGTHPEVLEELFHERLVDYVAMDVKAPLDERYHRLAGVKCDLGALQQSIDLLRGGTIDYEFRTTVCPAFTGEQEMVSIARAVEGAKRLILQPFRAVGCMDAQMLEVTPYKPERMHALAEAASPYVQECSVRGKAPVRVGNSLS